MKIAYIITAYTDPTQLRRLVDALHSPLDVLIFIYILI